MNTKTIINFVAFQINWLICVFGAAYGMPWLGPITVVLWLAVHVKMHQANSKPEYLLALFAATLGYGLDSLLVTFDVIHFPEQTQFGYLSPVWMVALWVNLAMTIRHSLDWLNHRNVIIALFGGVGGALAYWAGHQIGAIILTDKLVSSLIVFFVWSVALVTIYLVSNRLFSLFGRDVFHPASNDEHAHV